MNTGIQMTALSFGEKVSVKGELGIYVNDSEMRTVVSDTLPAQYLLYIILFTIQYLHSPLSAQYLHTYIVLFLLSTYIHT
jgi:hypothetical protein